jgi:hypothetical protein
MDMALSGSITFTTTYLGILTIQASDVRELSAGVDNFCTLDRAGRKEQRVRVELNDGTVLFGADNKFKTNKRKRKKNWRHC